MTREEVRRDRARRRAKRRRKNLTQKHIALLELLKREPRYSSDLEYRLGFNRAPTVINELKINGYQIDSSEEAGRRTKYSLLSPDPVPMFEVTDELEDAYYASRHWKRVRKRRRDFDGHRCVICHRLDHLEVHHWRYNLFGERNNDLLTLCDLCHVDFHTAAGGSGMHFPYAVTEEVFERLRRLL